MEKLDSKSKKDEEDPLGNMLLKENFTKDKSKLETNNKANLLNKTILIVNSGSIKKRFILQKIKKLGLKIIVLNKKEETWAKSYVDHWILADNTNHQEAIQAVHNFIVTNPEIKVNGVITFWEDDVLLCSRICDRFNFIGIPLSVGKKARNKFLFREFCTKNNLPAPKYSYIRSEEDIKKIVKNLSFPLVIKPVFGSSSAYVIKVENEEELRSSFEYIKNSISTNTESALSDGSDILAEEYIDGDEVDIDILMQNGKIKFFSITDNYQTKEPFFIETGQSIPSSLPKKEQDLLVEMAEETLEKMGVQNGCIHFEAKSTKKGPVPIEVNLRMGGDEVYSFIKGAWEVDLIENALKIAFGNYIKIKKPADPKKYLAGQYFLSENSGVLSQLEIDEKLKKINYIEEVVFFKKIGDTILVPPEGYDYLGWITAEGYNTLDAQENLKNTLKYINYEVAKFDPSSSIGIISKKTPLSNSNLHKSINIMRYSKIAKLKNLINQRSLHIGIAGNFDKLIPDQDNLGKVIQKTLKERGYLVTIFDFSNVLSIIQDIKKSNVDIIFNVCESINNLTLFEPHAAAIFDILNIPYIGSNSSTLSMCKDKIMVKKLLTYHKIPTPKWDYIYNLDENIRDDLTYPLIIKPSNTDDSIGITNDSVVTNKKDLSKQLEKIFSEIGCPVVIEEFIDGDEYDVSLLGTSGEDLQVLPLCRSIFNSVPKGVWPIYGFGSREENSEFSNNIELQIPPKKINKSLKSLITEMAIDTYDIFDCHDYGRVEIRVDKNNNPYVLELNPNPAINKHDIFTKCAKVAGFDYGDLIEKIISTAISRYQGNPPFYHLQY